MCWDFNGLGVIEAAPPTEGTDAETAAIEAGAQDLEPAEEGATRFYTGPTELDAVNKALSAAGWKVHSSALAWLAKSPHDMDEDEDVQHLFVGLEGWHRPLSPGEGKGEARRLSSRCD